jgi:DNA-binding NtrC family response regulator
MSDQPVVLLADDEETIRFALGRFLERHGMRVCLASTVAEARAVASSQPLDAALVDLNFPDGNGLTLLRELRAIDSTLPVIVLTGYGTIELAVQTIRDGAEQFLTKPIDFAVLTTMLERAIRARRERQALLAVEGRMRRDAIDPFCGDSVAIRKLASEAARIAPAPVPVLIAGETGSGKGVVARWLHGASARAEEAFVDLNCAGLPRELVESELFGHQRGAFTGAVAPKQGLFEVAHRGTLFLDEIGDLPLELQPRILKVVEEKCFRRVGEVQTRRVDFRLLAATHQNLEARSRQGSFRSDLYFRLSAVTLRVPALAERGRDVLLLAERMLPRLAAELGRPLPSLSPSAESALLAYPWPGNVRELRNVLERSLLLGESRIFEAADLGLAAGAKSRAGGPPCSLREAERRHLEMALEWAGYRVEGATAVLGLSRSALYEKISKHGLRLDERKAAPGGEGGADGGS